MRRPIRQSRIKDVKGDGGCLFRAIAKSIHPEQDETQKAKELQQSILEWVSKHRDYHVSSSRGDGTTYKVSNGMYLTPNAVDESSYPLATYLEGCHSITVDQYLKKYQTFGKWGGTFEIMIASILLQRRIKVYDHKSRKFLDFGKHHQQETRLIYANDHYRYFL